MVSMRILVTGDRFWFDPPIAASIVRRLVERCGSDITIVHGGATGVDEAEELRELYPSPKPQKVICGHCMGAFRRLTSATEKQGKCRHLSAGFRSAGLPVRRSVLSYACLVATYRQEGSSLRPRLSAGEPFSERDGKLRASVRRHRRVEHAIGRVGPTTPKSIDPWLLRSIRPKQVNTRRRHHPRRTRS